MQIFLVQSFFQAIAGSGGVIDGNCITIIRYSATKRKKREPLKTKILKRFQR
jgi:hypothetical protein